MRIRLRAALRLLVAVAAGGAAGCAPFGLLLPQDGLLGPVHFRGPASRPAVALTFDDGPNGACTAAVLDALAEQHAPATFFVLGRNVARGRSDELLARMVREGHAVALHGWSHEGPHLFFGSELRRDLVRASREVLAAEGRAGLAEPALARLYRPPFGLLTSSTARAATAEGFAVVLWTVSMGDWHGDWTPQDMADALLERTGPGAVIVLHDGNRSAHRSVGVCRDRARQADVVRSLVPRLRERGLDVVPLENLLGLREGPLPVPALPTAASPPRARDLPVAQSPPVAQSSGRSGSGR